jgi:hypothetical protein
LLALLDDHRASVFPREHGADADAVRRAISLRMVPAQESATRDAVLPRSSGLHKAWDDAHDMAERRGTPLIEPEHLVLALVAPSERCLSTTAKDLIAAGFRWT